MPTPDNESAFLEALQSIGAKAPLPPATVNPDPTEEIEAGDADRPTATTRVPEPPTKVTASNLWRHPDAHPIALDLLMLKKYGPEWLGWEVETIRHLIPEDFKTPSVSELNIAKLQACKTLHLVDAFWERWEVFIACLMPFNSEFPDFRIMSVPTVAQCLVACDAAQRIRQDVEWSTEMKAYFTTVYEHDGIFIPLPPINFVSPAVPDELDKAAVERRWPEVRASGQAPTGETPVDEQLRRLLVAHGYLEESRTRLQTQLSLHA